LITDQSSACLEDLSICVHLRRFDYEEDDVMSIFSASKVKSKKKTAADEFCKKPVKKSESDKNFFY